MTAKSRKRKKTGGATKGNQVAPRRDEKQPIERIGYISNPDTSTNQNDTK